MRCHLTETNKPSSAAMRRLVSIITIVGISVMVSTTTTTAAADNARTAASSAFVSGSVPSDNDNDIASSGSGTEQIGDNERRRTSTGVADDSDNDSNGSSPTAKTPSHAAAAAALPAKTLLSSSSAQQEAALNADGRILSFLGLMGRQQNEEFQECWTPVGQKGRCKYARDCTFPENTRPNLIQMMGYMCVINRFYIGVCCPKTGGGDDVASEKAVVPYDPVPDSDLPPVWGAAGAETGGPTTPRPEDRGCGIATRSFPKITGGRPADAGEWPWMAALLRRGPANAFCGGVLITDRHVLTAAHCMRRRRAAEVFVRLGEYNFAEFNETRARDFRVTDIRAHLDFDETTYEHDIALLKLDRAAVFTSYIWPVCMPPVGQSWEGYRAVVTGWGTQFFGGPPSAVLMEVALPVWTQARCQQAFAQRISERVLCAGAAEGGRDSCQGDSGGPLMVQLPNGRWTVVGVVSWGVRCGEPNFPGIYTKVDAYAGWILENAVF